MTEVTAYLALGSNLGERDANLNEALRQLRATQGLNVLKVSAFRLTEPYGVTDQPHFLNAVCQISTVLTPEALLVRLEAIEKAMGRIRRRHWGERNIDLDLLLYAERIISTPTLIVPHPDLANRLFVLEPLAEIAPDVWHPLLQQTVRQLLAALLASQAKQLSL